MTTSFLALDFLGPQRGRPRLIGAVLLALGLLGLCVTLALKYREDDEVGRLQEERAALEKVLHPRPMAAAREDPITERQIQRAEVVVDALALPWDPVLESIENAGTGGLGLLSLQPDPKARAVRITGQAKGVPELLGYLSRLNQQPLVARVILNSYETVAHDGTPAIQFNLTATWKPS